MGYEAGRQKSTLEDVCVKGCADTDVPLKRDIPDPAFHRIVK